LSRFPFQEQTQVVLQSFLIAHFAFPDNQKSPPQLRQNRLIAKIAFSVTLEFGAPEIQSGLRHARKFAVDIWVPMPKTAMHEDCLAPTRENEIGRAGQAPVMQAVPEAHGVNHAAHQHLGLAIASAHLRHARASCSGAKSVGHNPHP
jgi:hypothetical protein